MTKAEMFQQFIDNLKIDNGEQISLRYEEITACLNKSFRDTESKTNNSLQVGSYGRWTAIKGISDLDMLYIMPAGKWDEYKDGKQYQLLSDTKDAIKDRYPKTEVLVDRLVVQVLYKDYQVEVQPVFELDDGSFKYPDTYNGGSWKVTKPRDEIEATKEVDGKKNKNLRKLCKMARAWKNKHGVEMGGLLIDTLSHNFLNSTELYDDKSFNDFDGLSRDFFKYLSEEPSQDYYAALGSGQRVKVKQKFQRKAKKAYELCINAIRSEGADAAHDRWKDVYGRPFPCKPEIKEESSVTKVDRDWNDTEQFIEDSYPVDIRYSLKIECEVSQNGYREHLLTEMLIRHIPLLANKKLRFSIAHNVPEGYAVYWKVLNRGSEAQRRNDVRGQIVPDQGYKTKTETTTFRGEHIVECYIVKNNVVVAKDRIDVPIQ
jgi:hypothetical protein